MRAPGNGAITIKKQQNFINLLIFLPILLLLSGDIGYNVATSKYRSDQLIVPPRQDKSTILSLLNQIRTTKGLPLLSEDPVLDDTARLKAQDMADRNYYDHTTPDGKSFDKLIALHSPNLHTIGENLAECINSNEATVDAWVKSPEHYENILNPHYTLFGSATVYDQDKKCYITANHFGGS